jgi:hypothetical protein
MEYIRRTNQGKIRKTKVPHLGILWSKKRLQSLSQR